jgi:phosphoribosyl-ATP pyrophosphohydrolase/phosphoribosyl-AMP cyclohydrolase
MIQFDKDGLIPAVVQDATTLQVLVLAFMNEESYRLTRETGQAWFWSRSRQELWHKGGTSGHVLNVKQVLVNCEENSLLLLVDPIGPTCHTNNVSCYYRELEADGEMRPLPWALAEA